MFDPYRRRLPAVMCTTLFLVLSGCGGGGGTSAGSTASGGGSVTPPVSTIISGTAAMGAPLSGTVTAVDANGKVFSAVTDAKGGYSLDVAGGAGPFLLTVTGSASGHATNLTSMATAGGQTANITPLTDLIVSAAAGRPAGASLVALCGSGLADDAATCKSAAAAAAQNLAKASSAVASMIAPLNSAGTNPLTGSFSADGTGLDAVLDQIVVKPALTQGDTGAIAFRAVPSQQLGTLTLSATAGTLAVTTVVVPAATAQATSASSRTMLQEIRTCNIAFANLFPANMTSAPTAAQVAPFFDASFSLGRDIDQAGIVGYLSTLASSGEGGAAPGVTLLASNFSDFDFTRQSTASQIDVTKSAVGSTSAWVQIDGGTLDSGVLNWKMVKGAPYAGCPGGWKYAGTGVLDMHMDARVNKFISGANVTYTGMLPFHVETATALSEGVGSIVISGPALYLYSGVPTAPLGKTTAITLALPPIPVAPAVRTTFMTVQGLPNTDDSISSCQNLAAQKAAAGIPCFDGNGLAPNAVFTYTVYGSGATAGQVLYAFPYQISAVPWVESLIKANEKFLFAQNLAMTPATTSALNTATAGIAAGAPLDNIIKVTYTVSTVYGGHVSDCGIGLTNASNVLILSAEINASGQQTSCTFQSSRLNSGSLAKPSQAFGGTGSFVRVSDRASGMAASVFLAL